MHRRHEKRNVPIELLRALVTVVDTGSFTKAAETLNLTQSAISAQIARLGDLLGGSMFAKGPGISPTKRGLLALKYARRMVAINDQLLASAGLGLSSRQTLIGLPLWLGGRYLTSAFELCSRGANGRQVTFRCDHSEQLFRDLDSGALDIAFLCNVEDSWPNALVRWSEKTVWVKSPQLSLAPGAPIPLVAWPGSFPHRVAVDALHSGGMQFYISFSAPDFSARLAAAASGLGVLLVPERSLCPELEVIHEGLPLLPNNRTGLFSREGLDIHRVEPIIEKLKQVLAPPHSAEPDVSRTTKLPQLEGPQNLSARV
jgi:DNA-binding transcriptional LysR family regulator